MVQSRDVAMAISSLSSSERSQDIQAEIQATLGFVPTFFSPAFESLSVLENLWQQTQTAYLFNPLPALFKEKLSAYLSRFCAVPYCMICHSCSLYGLGMQAAAVLELLEAPPPREAEVEHHLAVLAAHGESLQAWPSDLEVETSVLYCAIFIALQPESSEPHRAMLRQLLGVTYYHYLVSFIAYVKTCHVWMESNPEVAYQDDRRVQDYFASLTADTPELADFFINYWERVRRDRQTWAEQQAELAERQRHELALRRVGEENRYLGQAIAAASEGILVTDPHQLDNPVVYANPAFLRMTGYELKEVIGRNCRFLQGPDTDSVSVGLLRQAIQEQREATVTLLNYRKDGQPFWNELKISPVFSERGELIYFIGLQTDVSERIRSEESLKKQAQLLELAHDAIIVRDIDDRITFWNQGAEKIYGWPREQAYDQNSQVLLETQFPKPLGTIQAELLANNYWEGELLHTRQDGQQRSIASRWALQRDNDGKPIAILEINNDITEKKALEAQFFRAQRMESIGTLAGGIAHDLNNILTPILSSAQLLLMHAIADEKKQQQLLETIQASARRGGALIKQVLSFARGVEGKHTALQVRHLITEIREIAHETFPKSIDMEMDIAPDLWLVSGEATQLHQVLMNLCVNARDAMPDGGRLRLKAANLHIDEQYTRMNLDAHVGPYIVLTVTDTGMGIAPDILERIFDPFFTTKELGRGTGLGLSTVLAIIKGHGGFIDVSSTVGKGTQFRVYLPAVHVDELTPVPEETFSPGQGQMILVVDDEAAIREVSQASLEAYNYRVLTANDGIEAIALYAQHKEEIELVLIDLMMPVMDGPTTIRTLRKINPQVKIVAVSGLLSSTHLPSIVGTDLHAFLPKPYTAKELAKCLSDVLNAG
ncbi:PAS domain S-box protein [Leptolyngbya sp. FACHB-16]|nr:PAS domain S-box protein [Leptolyngbya sp. FACHB-16]